MYRAPTPAEMGARIRRRREALGMKQVRLAEAVGITRHRMCNLELGKARPDYECLALVASALRVNPARLLGW